MSQRRETKVYVGGDTMTSGLDMSAGRDMIDETQLWNMEGMYANTDKTLSKRQALVTWGTQIAEPTPVDATNNEEISKLIIVNDDWTDVVETGTNSYITVYRGAIQCSGSKNDPAETGSATITRPLLPDETYNTTAGYDSDITLSFVARFKNLASFSNMATLKFAVEEDVQKEITFSKAGLAIKVGADVWATVNGTSGAVDGDVHRIDVTVTNNGTCTFDIDGAEVYSGAWTYAETTSDTWLELECYSNENFSEDTYSMEFSSFILRDSDVDALAFPEINDITNLVEIKESSSIDVVSLLVAGDRYLWYDYALGELWRPLASMPKANSFFGKFRGDTILCSHDNTRKTSVYRINAQTREVEHLNNAPNLRFTAQFINRLWGAGDVDHPLRLYYSGDRQPNLWHNPSDPDNPATEDSELQSGYFDFPGAKNKSRVSLISDDFFGSLLVAVDSDIYMMSGTSPADLQRKKISSAVGAEGERCGLDVSNDFWLMGQNGIVSVVATDKFGDLESKRLSSSVRDLFNTDKASGRMLNPKKLRDAKLAYLSKINTVFLYAEEYAKENPGVIYTVNLESGKWSGPWRENLTAMRNVKLASPIKESIIVGTADGYVKRLTASSYNREDIIIESPEINGRSIHPRAPAMKKTFRSFQLEIVPTGAWDITFEWKVDDNPWKTITKKLANPDKHHVLGTHAGWTSFTTGTSLAKSNTQPMIIDFALDTRGLSLKYKITSSAPRVILKRWGLDFSIDGLERD